MSPETILLGALIGGAVVWTRAAWQVHRARRDQREAKGEAIKVVRGWGKCSGRVLRQQGEKCPNAWPSNDPELDAFNKGCVEGWREMDREMSAVVWEAEQITRGAA